ncbi:MAG: hypothetical protein M1166_02445 [Candidatus Thermoplasmatota archaeon]|jgi:hypothetical protein|nr:hypothetical protein [Candidatus Thermoplasmatota archaeon]
MALSKSGKPDDQKLDGETELSVLKEILTWTKISGMKQVKTILSEALNDELKRILYQLSDGSRSTREILSKYKLQTSRASIQKLWKQWSMLGIGESMSVKGGGQRFKRLFDLDAFGIEYKMPTEDVDKFVENVIEKQKISTVQEGKVEAEDN